MKNGSELTVEFPGLHSTEVSWEGADLPARLESLTSGGSGSLTVVDLGASGSGESEAHAELMDGLHEFAGDSALNLPGGEQVKTLSRLRELWNRMHQERIGRDGWVVVIGGGATLDLGALAGSTWHRGVRLALVPTTFLGMVDAAVGGKTAINFGSAKNQLGTFYPAHRVLVSVHFLETLPTSELRNGIVEAIKTGFLFDEELVELLEDHAFAITDGDPELAERVSRICLEHKGRVVRGDTRDEGRRRLLNFGHTTGHALEAWGKLKAEARGDSRKRIPHGRAVAWGMLIASEIARGRGWLEADYQVRLLDIYERYGLPLALSEGWAKRADELFELAGHDKKRRSGQVSFILPRGIGEAEQVYDVDLEEFSSAMSRLSG